MIFLTAVLLQLFVPLCLSEISIPSSLTLTKRNENNRELSSHNGNSNGWFQQKVGQTITFEDGAEQLCGFSVGVSKDGKTIIVGCPHATINGKTDAGAVHIFKLVDDRQGEDTWRRLVLGDDALTGEGARDHLGLSVSYAKDADVFAIGDPQYKNAMGRVRIFSLRDGEVTQRGNEIRGLGDEHFLGRSVDLSSDGNTVAVGASRNQRTGYVSVLSFSENESWFPEEFIAGGQERGRFGSSLSLSQDGKKVGIGELADETAVGRATVYDVDDSSNIFQPFLGEPNELFASAVSLTGDGKLFDVLTRRKLHRFDVSDLSEKDSSPQIIELDRLVNETLGESCGVSVDSSFDGRTTVIGCTNKAIIVSFDENGALTTMEERSFGSRRNLNGRLLGGSFSAGYYSVSISSDGKTIVIGSPEFGQVEVLSSVPSPVSPTAPTPTALNTNPPPSPPITGKCKKKGKGKSKSKTEGSKGKGRHLKKPKASKGKAKKSKKNNQKCDNQSQNARDQCSVPDGAKELSFRLPVIITGTEIDVELLNEFLCNEASTRRNRHRELNSIETNVDNYNTDELSILSVFVTSLEKLNEGELSNVWRTLLL